MAQSNNTQEEIEKTIQFVTNLDLRIIAEMNSITKRDEEYEQKSRKGNHNLKV